MVIHRYINYFLQQNGLPRLKQCIKQAMLGSVGVVLLFSCNSPKDKSKPSTTTPYNVLFISVDDLRPALGCYGNTVVKTPNIDKLAASAMAFNRAYSQAAVCMPSRASIMSGIRPENFKKRQLNGDSMDENVPNSTSLPDFFKQEGYQTISIGKIYHHNNDDKDGWSKRYTETFVEEKFGGHGYASRYTDSIHQKAVYNYLNAWSNKSLLDSVRPPSIEKADIPDSLHIDGKVTKLAVSELKNLKAKGEKFFLDFLDEDQKYEIQLFTDGPNADRNAEDYLRKIYKVSSKDLLSFDLAPGGGMAAVIKKIK